MLNLIKEHEGFSSISSSPMGERTLPWLPGSALTLFCAALFETSRSSVCVIVPTEAKAMTLARDLEATRLPTEAVRFFPDRDLFRESPEIQPERAEVFAGIAGGSKGIIVGSLRSILHLTLPPGQVRSLFRRVKLGESILMESLLDLLVRQGYRRVAQVEARGEFAVRGGILDLFCPQETVPFRLEWWGDRIHSIRTFDPGSQRRHPTSGALPEEIFLFPAAEPLLDPIAARENLVSAIKRTGVREHLEALSEFYPRWEQGFSYIEREWYLRTLLGGEWSFADSLPPDTLYLLLDPFQLERQSVAIEEEMKSLFSPHLEAGELFPVGSSPYLSYRQLPERLKGPVISFSATEAVGESLLGECKPLPGFSRDLDAFLETVRLRLSEERRIVVASHQSSRIKEILSEHGITSFPLAPDEIPEKGRIHVISSRFQEGFFWPALDLVLITDKELFGYQEAQTTRRKQPAAFILRPGELKEGDFVVHMHHGIGIFRGVKRLLISGVEKDYLDLEYAKGDRLYLPIDNMERIDKYSALEEDKPTLSRLGTGDWTRTTARAKKAVQDTAKELLKLQAARVEGNRSPYSPDTHWQREMEEAFPYEETPDQNRAVLSVKKEMEEAHPMDRLICGDVGYGKTEVALRAAFKAIQDGKQVALLAPTTILASQHYSTFRERLATFPLTVEMLSRFKSPREQKAIISSLTEGKVDLVVGTHRLLSRDIHFRDLGLVIIDEEQRFGVKHKEKLKKLKGLVDVLTLTATPIPRTLYLSLAGIRNMSVIETPPSGRLPVKTFLYPSDDQLIRQVILRELDRGGQVYYVHNRVETIEGAALRIRRLIPFARIAVGHGQMKDGRLEQVMLDFMEGESDILLCTTIIENGLDIPRVNTLIVEDAQNFGLAQLYQLRGRVGRSSVQAYAYFLYPPHKRITPHAEKRLEAIQEFTELGSGYYLALRDMEIRGAGNILGTQQHGHIAAIGFDLYCKLLASAVVELKGEKEKVSEPIPQIDIPVTAFVPEEYVADKRQKISLYQRMAGVRDFDEVKDLREELLDRFGPVPPEVEALLSVLALRCLAAGRGIALLAASDRQIKIKMSWGRGVSLDELERLRKHPNIRLTLKPDALLLDLYLAPDRWTDFSSEVMSQFDEVK